MKRNSIILVVFLSLLLSLATVVTAAPERTAIFVAVNDQMLTFPDVQPDVKAGTTYVPFYRFAEAIGGQAAWNSSTNQVTLSQGAIAVTWDLNNHLLLNQQGDSSPFDMYLKSDRAMVPMRVLGSEFGYATSYIPTGPIARMKDASAKLTDQQLYAKYKAYINSTRAKEQPKPAPQPQPKPKPTSDKIAYLTFDDGPNQYTKSILTTLQNYGVNATFFMLEPGIKAYPDIVKWMKQDGHSLGLHGVTHDYHLLYRSAQSVVDEMEEDNQELTAVTGVRSSIVRLPYGSVPWMNPKSYRDTLTSAGYHFWDWNIDSTDSSAPSVPPGTILSEVEKQVQGKKEAVILMHDKKTTAEALPSIIEYLQQHGYQFKKIYGSTPPVNFWNDER